MNRIRENWLRLFNPSRQYLYCPKCGNLNYSIPMEKPNRIITCKTCKTEYDHDTREIEMDRYGSPDFPLPGPPEPLPFANDVPVFYVTKGCLISIVLIFIIVRVCKGVFNG